MCIQRVLYAQWAQWQAFMFKKFYFVAIKLQELKLLLFGSYKNKQYICGD
jgi:hypothetical protein